MKSQHCTSGKLPLFSVHISLRSGSAQVHVAFADASVTMAMRILKHILRLCLLTCLFPQLVCAGMWTSTLLERAEDYYAGGRYLEALSLYSDCVNNSETDAEKAAALFGIGLLFDQYLDDCEQALTYYSRHIELQGEESARALHYSARVMMRQSRPESARVCYRELLLRYPAYAADNAIQDELKCCVSGAVEHAGLFDRDRLRNMSGLVRVLIENGNDPVEIKGSPDLFVAPDGSADVWTHHDTSLVVRADNDSLFVNDARWEHAELIIRGGHKDRLQVNGRWYRSRVRVRAENGRVLVVNHVGLEQYLYGVLPRETYVSWPAAALQAQAVAARTYALYHMLVRQGCSYDVFSTTSSQVYGGLDGEHPATNRAVDATRDLVLFNGRQLVLALYHANSGGVVEAVEDVWGARLPYLLRVVDTPSLQGRGAQWTCSLSASEVVERLVNYGVACKNIESIQPVKRSGSGRVEQVALGGQGASVVISGNSLRLMLGPSVVKSTRFIVENVDESFVFTGTGYGHGVGMSQWGAYAIAKNKDDYQSILAHYYPGTELAAWNTHGQPATGFRR